MALDTDIYDRIKEVLEFNAGILNHSIPPVILLKLIYERRVQHPNGSTQQEYIMSTKSLQDVYGILSELEHRAVISKDKLTAARSQIGDLELKLRSNPYYKQ